jgi:hypothetical protein
MFSGRSPRTPSSWPSMTRMMSASDISDAGRASQKPPSGPRWLRMSPARRSWVKIVSRNFPGICCARAS